TEAAVTLFPQPESPTRPSVSPGATRSETPSTARRKPASVSKPTARFSMSRSASVTGTLRAGGSLGILDQVVGILVDLLVHRERPPVAHGLLERRLALRIDPEDEPVEVLLRPLGEPVVGEPEVVPVG